MVMFKCKMCGGDLEIHDGMSIATCEYCGTNQTLPKLNNEKIINLYNHANLFRRSNEYDKAIALYEKIIIENSSDAEAYWSIVLCKYGVEYVEDPVTKKRIPTCNRTIIISVLADEDFKMAIKLADVIQKDIFIAEANEIDRLQKEILKISKKEKPFDVFICYKELDSNGQRTKDSVLAQDLYFQLTKENFKVFFAKITLEDKLGQAYEPYIFSALTSAKVMIVIGTQKDYYNTVWVKNEWSRFLALCKTDSEKTLIPAYKDMDPYDLPDEFALLQAQDMGKLGFMQDLIFGIKKIINKRIESETVDINLNHMQNTNVVGLIKRAKLFLEDGNFSDANEYAEKILDVDPELAEAYMIKLCVDLQVNSLELLIKQNQTFENNANFIKAVRFANLDYKEEILNYNKIIRNNNAEKEKHQAYEKALELIDKHDYANAITALTELGDYKDCVAKIEFCNFKILENKKENIYINAKLRLQNHSILILDYENSIKDMQTLGDYKDASILAQQYSNALADYKLQQQEVLAKNARDAEEKRIMQEQQAEQLRISQEQQAKDFKIKKDYEAEIKRIKTEKRYKKLTRIMKIAVPLLMGIVVVTALIFVITAFVG